MPTKWLPWAVVVAHWQRVGSKIRGSNPNMGIAVLIISVFCNSEKVRSCFVDSALCRQAMDVQKCVIVRPSLIGFYYVPTRT